MLEDVAIKAEYKFKNKNCSKRQNCKKLFSSENPLRQVKKDEVSEWTKIV